MLPAKHDLSTREIEVMHCLLLGLSNEEIAKKMGLSVTTIKTHLRRIFIKLEVGSRLQAVYKFNSLNFNNRI